MTKSNGTVLRTLGIVIAVAVSILIAQYGSFEPTDSPTPKWRNVGATVVVDPTLRPKPTGEHETSSASALDDKLLNMLQSVAMQTGNYAAANGVAENTEPNWPKSDSLENSTFFHKTYTDYLAAAWNNHAGIVVSPDSLWFLYLTELSSYIQAHPDDFRSMFTTSRKKDEIRVPYDGRDSFMQHILEALHDRVPANISMFLPDFSTGTKEWKKACATTFISQTNPYYDFIGIICGIPSITFTGHEADWTTFFLHLEALRDLFSCCSAVVTEYTARFMNEVQTLLTGDVRHLYEFFHILPFEERQDVYSPKSKPQGHHQQLFLNQNRYVPIVPYTVVGGSRPTWFVAMSGMFTSTLGQDNVLRPAYHTLHWQIFDHRLFESLKVGEGPKPNPEDVAERVAAEIVAYGLSMTE
ncbi:hypothetical protein HDU85_005112 [Gaertneriomyces sp. JEL0708]|nr:hypothetical protein HDU85_005112 [Gaertneriomyces sp. JEL0708]